MHIMEQWIITFKKETKNSLEAIRRQEFIKCLIANKYKIGQLEIGQFENILNYFGFILTVEELLTLLNKKK